MPPPGGLEIELEKANGSSLPTPVDPIYTRGLIIGEIRSVACQQTPAP